MNSFIEHFKKYWEELPKSEQDYSIELLALCIGQFIAYFMFKKMGAPKWAAWGFAVTSSSAAHVRSELKRRVPLKSELELESMEPIFYDFNKKRPTKRQ